MIRVNAEEIKKAITEKENLRRMGAPALAALVLVLSVFGPEWLARYQDKSTLNQIVVEETDGVSEGYRYMLSSNEKLYLLSECLFRQSRPQSELSRRVRTSSSDAEVDYDGLLGGYAFVVNRQGPSGKEITDEQIFDICNRELETLKERSILPQSVREVEASAYTATLYSAIDVPEPQNNMSVWRISLSTSQQNADKRNRLIDAYIDADTGQIYGFYARTEEPWDEGRAEETVRSWSAYLGLTGMEAYDSENPLLETTPYFLKYRFPGMDGESTVVTVGFYEGIGEWFIKII